MNLPQVGAISVLTILFSIGIFVGYSYVEETRQNQMVLNKTQSEMNASLNLILEKQQKRTETDNIRFNATLNGINKTYDLIIDNQGLIIDTAELVKNNTHLNLNLTKFNRASLVDSNYVIRTIARYLNVTVDEFDDPNRPH